MVSSAAPWSRVETSRSGLALGNPIRPGRSSANTILAIARAGKRLRAAPLTVSPAGGEPPASIAGEGYLRFESATAERASDLARFGDDEAREPREQP